MLYRLLRPLLFRGDPEQTHERVLATVDGLSSLKGFNSLSEQIFRWESPLLETQLWDRLLPNPVGLAADRIFAVSVMTEASLGAELWIWVPLAALRDWSCKA